MFAALPQGFPALTNTLARLGHHADAESITDTRSLGQRLRSIFAAARADSYQSVRLSDWRKLPYALWLDGAPSLAETDPGLVIRYWDQHLTGQTRGRPTQATRWLAPLLHFYIHEFAPERSEFAAFADNLRTAVLTASGPLAADLRELDTHQSFFAPMSVAKRLADRLAAAEASAEDWMVGLGLPSELPRTRLGSAVFDAMLRTSEASRRLPSVVKRILRWAQLQPTRPEHSSHRVSYANGLLLPWREALPPDDLKQSLVVEFVRPDSYGDPRLSGRVTNQWIDVDPHAVSTMKRWLAGDTLRAFVHVLEHTADDTWRFRQKFWMAYHDQGYIEDAWLALGPKAFDEFKRTFVKRSERCAELKSQDSRQSVLILKLGGLVFTEWSHNGALRAYREDSGDAPNLYESAYDRSDLVSRVSLRMHPSWSENLNPRLSHTHSESGTWQRSARDFIHRETGIYLRNEDVQL